MPKFSPVNVNLRPPIISETTGARKLKLKTQLDVVKYSLQVQKFFPIGGVQGTGPPNVNLGLLDISETARARKLNLKILLYVPALGTKIIILYDTT